MMNGIRMNPLKFAQICRQNAARNGRLYPVERLAKDVDGDGKFDFEEFLGIKDGVGGEWLHYFIFKCFQ